MVRLGVLVLALVGVGVASSARAEDTAFESARREFETGVDHLKEGRLEDAASAFERSLKHRDSPKVRYNLGLTCHHLQRVACAREQLTAFIEVSSHNGELADRAWTILRRLAPESALLEIDLRGEPDAVTLDGVHLVGSLVGTQRRIVTSGEHAITATKRGFEPTREQIESAPGERILVQVKAGLEREAAYIAVAVAHPKEATVVIDGTEVGRQTYDGTIEPGAHELEVRADGFVPRRFRVDVAPGHREVINVTLEEQSGSLATSWWLWAIVGAVVVSGAVAYLATEPRPDGGSLDFVARGIHGR